MSYNSTVKSPDKPPKHVVVPLDAHPQVHVNLRSVER
jgi:hypothetical protein